MVTPPRDRRTRPVARLLSSAVAAVVAGTLVPGPAAATSEAGSAGIGDDYFPLDGNGGIDVRHYDIHDRYRFRSGRLSGRTVLTVAATQQLSSFHLDFLLPVNRVRVDGEAAEFSRPHRHELAIELPSSVPAGRVFEVTVGYDGRPRRVGYAGERNWLADRHEVVAMNQPHMAPWWFPSNDHPRDKATMDIAVTVPRGMHAVANGRRVGRSTEGRLTTHRWRSEEPMATYLATFAAGRFRASNDVVGGLPYRLLASRRLGQAAQRASMRFLRRTPRVVAILERDLGPYPFSSAGGLVTSLPVGFALENQTLPTYPYVGGGSTWLVVHEQAHQWFGDSVSLTHWRDIWLNEGAATFMEIRYAERRGRLDAARWLRRTYRAHGASDGFWRLPIGDPGPDRIFDDAVYVRGAMTFQALRNRIGEDDFWRLVRRWLRQHRHGNATGEQFELLAEAVSGEELDAFFDAWLRTASRPARTEVNGLG